MVIKKWWKDYGTYHEFYIKQTVDFKPVDVSKKVSRIWVLHLNSQNEDNRVIETGSHQSTRERMLPLNWFIAFK